MVIFRGSKNGEVDGGNPQPGDGEAVKNDDYSGIKMLRKVRLWRRVADGPYEASITQRDCAYCLALLKSERRRYFGTQVVCSQCLSNVYPSAFLVHHGVVPNQFNNFISTGCIYQLS